MIKAKVILVDTANDVQLRSTKLYIKQSGQWKEQKANAEGVYEITQPLPGTAEVKASAPGYPEKEFPVSMNPKQSSNPIKLGLDLQRNVFFSIYYSVSDNAFKRASDTWQVTGLNGPHPFYQLGRDVVITREVKTEGEFKAAWQAIYLEASKPARTVVEGHIFSHASKGSKEDGLEFKKDEYENGTLIETEISKLNKLPWAKEGLLVLHSCNSGLNGNRGWSPARSFARSQSVKTIGQNGFAYFSTEPDRYVEINGASSRVYLWAFKRKRNGWTGDGEKIPPLTYLP